MTNKQQRFCREYIIDYHGENAAKRAGYSDRSARSIASKLLANDEIKKAIRELEQQAIKQTQIDRNYIIENIKRIAENPLNKDSVRLNAFIQLGKYIGMEEQLNDVEKDIEINVNII